MPQNQNSPPAADDFTITLASEADADTVVLTGAEQAERWIAEAVSRYDPTNQQYSAYMLDSVTASDLTADELDTLAEDAQNKLKNILSINAAVRKQINADDIIGKVYECIDTNVNTDYRLSFRRLTDIKAKAKKIIHQVLRKGVMGPDYCRKGLEDMMYAHQNFMSAWKQGTVVVTTPPAVERITYIEPKADKVNAEKISLYRARIVAALGVSFLTLTGSRR